MTVPDGCPEMGRGFPPAGSEMAVYPLKTVGTKFALVPSVAAEPTRLPDARPSIVDIPRKPPNRKRRNLILAVGGLLAVALVTWSLGRLRSAAPVIDRAALWTDTVKRGAMLRDVKGPGTLVPEQIRLITADTAGRVERIPLRPGAQVEQGTVLMELSNPDVMLQALDAERQLAQA